MADPVSALPEELRPGAPYPPPNDRAFALLRRRDFRLAYAAVATSELGDAFQYIALMWFALVSGGPLGVLAVRLADSLPALLFGFHGGLLADRRDRRRLLIGADLFRGALLVPVALAGLTGNLPLWGLVVVAFLLTTATSYFEPAYGALLPGLVERRNVQAANGLVRASADALAVGGWGLAAALLSFLPISAFFAVNAASFMASALLLARLRPSQSAASPESSPPRVRDGFAALRPHRALTLAVVVLGVAVTISSGTWMVGVPQLVRHGLGRGAGSFSLIAMAYAVGSIAAGITLAKRPVRRKALVAMLAWTAYLPAYAAFAFARSLPLALAGGLGAGIAQGSSWVLVNSAAQQEIPDRLLGRVMGLVSLVHRGAHATGLLLVAPLFAITSSRNVFAAAALALPLVGIAGALAATSRGGGARGAGRPRILRS